jgi:hypothetical protein
LECEKRYNDDGNKENDQITAQCKQSLVDKQRLYYQSTEHRNEIVEIVEVVEVAAGASEIFKAA